MISESDHWDGIEIRHFVALEAIASEGSFRRAAETLGYTQSAVSQQIATLERIAGERLIDRPGGPRAVSLTDAGRLLLRHAEAIVAHIHAAQADMESLVNGVTGSLRVGTYQSVSRSILPDLMRRFVAAWPQLEVLLTESADDGELLHGIERGELDVTFATLPLPDGPFEGVELLCDPYVVVAQTESELARNWRSQLGDIAGVPLIGFRQCRSLMHLDAYLESRGIRPNMIFKSDDNGTVQGLVAAGIGAALVPRLTVDGADSRVTLLPIEDDVPPRRIGLAWHRDRYRSPAARAFIAAAQDVATDLVSARR
jgi:DNA-binding transcriptional LysR family regulator